MKTLVLVRHGITRRDDITISDEERPLTSIGRRETMVAADLFAALGIQPDQFVTSPAARAKETVSIWQKVLKFPGNGLTVVPDIYEAERSTLFRLIRELDDAHDTVILVGHNPGVTAMLHHLVGGKIESMSPGSFAVITLEIDSWSRIALRDAELIHYYAPQGKDLQQSLWHRFVFWRRQRVQKVELMVVFLVVLLVILGLVAFLVRTGASVGQ